MKKVNEVEVEVIDSEVNENETVAPKKKWYKTKIAKIAGAIGGGVVTGFVIKGVKNILTKSSDDSYGYDIDSECDSDVSLEDDITSAE